MKILSPWPNHPHIRFNVNNGECLGTFGVGLEIEIPDNTVEVLLEAVDRGDDVAKVIAPALIWSKEFGMVDAEIHLKKMEMRKEEAAMKAQREAEQRRKQEEAEAKKAAEAKAKSAEAKKAKEAKPKIDVERAASGLAKVTKALKPKK